MQDGIYKYGKHITWSIPIAFQYEAVWGAIFKNFQEYGIDIHQVNGFGSPWCAWTGGRVPAVRHELSQSVLLRIFRYLRSIKVTPSFTFSCTALTEDDFNNKYTNNLLDIAIEAGSHFIIYDDRLKDYIKSKDPNAYVVASVIKSAMRFQGSTRIENPNPENETEFYNKLLKEYDMVVVRPEYSDTVLLEHPDWIDDISRIEVLINQPCVRECPRMPDHYRHMEQFRMQKPEGRDNFECARKGLRPELHLKNTMCHNQEVVRKLVENGVRHLKLQGRGVRLTMDDLMSLLYSQMFNTDGPYNLPYTSLYLHNKLEAEFNYFNTEIIRAGAPK